MDEVRVEAVKAMARWVEGEGCGKVGRGEVGSGLVGKGFEVSVEISSGERYCWPLTMRIHEGKIFRPGLLKLTFV